MPDPLSDDEFTALLDETDTFKLAIRGAWAIEAEIDAAIARLAHVPIPRELRGTRYEIRLAVAVASGVVFPEDQPLFRAIAKLRNELAHGKLRELTPARARALVDTALPVLGMPSDEEQTVRSGLFASAPVVMLRFALMVARTWVRRTTEYLLKRREEEQRIVASHREVAQLVEQLAAKVSPPAPPT